MNARSIALPVLIGLVPCSTTTLAQPASGDFPHRSLRMVVPFPPGGSVDPMARILAARLGARLGQQIVVDNMPGAGGVIAAQAVMRAGGDGYTMLFATPTIMVNGPLINKSLPYHPMRDFDPVSLVVANAFVLTLPASLPVASLQELISAAKRKPGAFNFGSVGEAAPQRIAIELLKSMTSIDIVHVPYKGGGQIQVDLMAGRIQLYASSIIGVAANVKSGKLRALAMTGARRAGAMPDVPTVAESDVPGYDFETWYAVFAPAKTAAAAVNRLNTEIAAVLVDPALVKSMEQQGSDLRSSTPAALAAIIKRDTERLAPLFQKLGLTTQ